MRRALLALLLLAACASDASTLYEVELTGRITAGGGRGAVEVQLHHAEAGEGELAHPLGEVDRFETSLGEAFAHVFLYPQDEGTGLVVYAWHDADGDSALCRPGGEREPSGLVEVEGFPRHEVAVELELDAECAGPEGLFP